MHKINQSLSDHVLNMIDYQLIKKWIQIREDHQRFYLYVKVKHRELVNLVIVRSQIIRLLDSGGYKLER